ASPEKVNRAAFADEPRTELLHHAISLGEGEPEAVRLFAVVSRVFGILFEWDRVFGFDRLGQNADLDTERSQRRHEFAIKISHGLRAKRERMSRASARLNAKVVINEIEIYLKSALVIRDRRGRQAARSDIQRDLPPVIDHRRLRKPHLADDLRP